MRTALRVHGRGGKTSRRKPSTPKLISCGRRFSERRFKSRCSKSRHSNAIRRAIAEKRITGQNESSSTARADRRMPAHSPPVSVRIEILPRSRHRRCPGSSAFPQPMLRSASAPKCSTPPRARAAFGSLRALPGQDARSAPGQTADRCVEELLLPHLGDAAAATVGF